MGDDARLAFEHPEERAKATADRPYDRISLRDHVVEAEIGAFQIERGVTQRMSFNVVVEVRPSQGADTDDVDDILSYDRVTEAISAELEVERLALLETLAERIADRILREPQALRVFVRIEKLDRGNGKLGVEIVRSTEDLAPVEASDEAVSPLVVHLTDEALRSDRLSSWIDQFALSETPVVLSVDAPDDVPHLASKIADRNVVLLAIEQAAWRLASIEPRCIVVASKTELDWGMKNGQISVWAPSKLVLDSSEIPDVDFRVSASLAGWFAEQIKAEKLLILGKADVQSSVPIKSVSVDTKQLTF